jgi:beta-lactamase regulating signal transducer with metallopeptidase domain
MNLFQLLAEAVFSFNPALLWLSAVLREECEHCCDDLAITTTHNKKGFVQALISFRERNSPAYALAFPATKNRLLKRVSRIVYDRNAPPDAAGIAFMIASLILLAMLVKASMDKMTPAIPKEQATTLVKARVANFSTLAPAAASANKRKTKAGVTKSVKTRIELNELKRDDRTMTAVETVPLLNAPIVTGTDVSVNMIQAEQQPNENVRHRVVSFNNGSVRILREWYGPQYHNQVQKDPE